MHMLTFPQVYIAVVGSYCNLTLFLIRSMSGCSCWQSRHKCSQRRACHIARIGLCTVFIVTIGNHSHLQSSRRTRSRIGGRMCNWEIVFSIISIQSCFCGTQLTSCQGNLQRVRSCSCISHISSSPHSQRCRTAVAVARPLAYQDTLLDVK